jgi:hypothetical protein
MNSESKTRQEGNRISNIRRFDTIPTVEDEVTGPNWSIEQKKALKKNKNQ